MLVLSRRAGESIMIGDDVVVTILEIRGDIVRVGVDAPRDVTVHREEVYRELEAAGRASTRTGGDADSETAFSSLLPKAPRAD